MQVPLSSPEITEEDIAAVVEVMRNGRLSVGPRMVDFEAAMASYIGVDHAIAVSSGTAGLHLCLRALGIGAGDEVIVPSFTFIAAANPIRYERANPVFVDIDPRSLNLDPSAVEAAVTPRTRAILVIHTFGVPAQMDAICEIAQRHRLYIIEDACEALGASYNGRRVGGLGDAGVFGFYPNKQITAGEGGMVVTNQRQFADRVRALRNQGRYDSLEWLQHQELGYNYRLSEMNCALALSQLGRIDEILRMREDRAGQYEQALGSRASIELPLSIMPGAYLSWFVYVVRLSRRFTKADRDAIIEGLKSDGIQCGRYFAPIHLQPAYSAWRQRFTLPVTEHIGERVIALPFFTRISDEQIQYVSARLIARLEEIERLK